MWLRGWGIFGGNGLIYRFVVYLNKGWFKWFCVFGGIGWGEVMVWDFEKMVCREVYCMGGESVCYFVVIWRFSVDIMKLYEVWDVDEDKLEGMLGCFVMGEMDE